MDNQQEEIAYLRTPAAIRERCDRLFNLCCEDKLNYFSCDLTQLDRVADYVIKVIYEQYPDLNIPFHSRWRHFEVGGVSRLSELDQALSQLTPIEKAQTKFDLAIISVLLDAGAGNNWQYYEQETAQIFKRSEGLAVASFRMFCQGKFSSNKQIQADAIALYNLKIETLAQGFQVNQQNYLVGLEGRVKLLQSLGKTLINNPEFFGYENHRPGNLVNYLLTQTKTEKYISATKVLTAVLEALGAIWPGRYEIAGINLGDAWIHSALKERYVPFHKLSQWLTYSLLEPLQELGYKITELDQLTGLPEYRNGGLLLDLGLLQTKHPSILQESHPVNSEVIVEWRALTVILLDKIAANIRQKLNLTAPELPLVKILQGGTWTAGRKIAAELRKHGVPPIKIISDGTVF